MQIKTFLIGAPCLALLGTGLAYGASISKADKDFMTMAANTDMIEAHEAQMAENQARRDEVKTMAKTLEQDHTMSYQKLTALAAKTGVEIPKGIDTRKDRAIVQLGHLKGDGFDRAFMQDQIAAHRRVLALYKHEAEHGTDPDIKAFASQEVPSLEKHLRMAEESSKTASRGHSTTLAANSHPRR